MSWLKPILNAGMIVNQATDRRAQLGRHLGLKNSDKLIYVYVGRYGQSDLDWPRLGRQEFAGMHFVTYGPLPSGAPANLHAVPSPDWPGGDLIASCDVVFAKAGYGTACEAMARGTPIIYPPRHGFAEHRSLDRCLRDWGGGLPISSLEFRSLRVKRA